MDILSQQFGTLKTIGIYSTYAIYWDIRRFTF